MVKHYHIKLILLFLAIGVNNAFSQEDTSLYKLFTKGFLDSINIDELLKHKSKSYVKFQTSYLSNAVYQGRKDINTTQYLTPTIEYNHKSGLFASASFSYLANDNSRIDSRNFCVGYSFDTSHHFGGSVYFSKPFYNTQSTNIKSDIKFSTSGSLTYYTGVVNITSTSSISFGESKTDFGAILTLNHYFDLSSDTVYHTFSLDPTIAVYMGTSGIYQTYKSKRDNNRRPFGVPDIPITSTASNKFQVMSYEFCLPISYDRAKWGVFLTPYYVIATNPITTRNKAFKQNGLEVPLPSDVPQFDTEKLSNSFFVEMGCYYKF